MQPEQTLTDRVRYFYETLYFKNQLAMAKEMKISQASVSKVLSGDRMPGRKFLAALAACEKVNPDWLYSGTGTPFREPLKTYQDRLPILRTIPSHEWTGEEDHLTTNWPVMPGLYTKGCYFLEAQSNMPLVKSSALAINKGDLLLMKPLKDYPLRANDLDERLAVVETQNTNTKEPDMVLGQLNWHQEEDGSYFTIDTWVRKIFNRPANAFSVTIEIQGQRIIDSHSHPILPPSDSLRKRKAILLPENPRIKKQGIVAYCEQLLRVYT